MPAPSREPAIVVRLARADELSALDRLIAHSARELGEGYYTPAESEAAIAHIFGVDSELVADGTYYVAEADGEILGCGGWSRRATLFGGDRFAGREAGLLDPAQDAARIRAFFTAPAHARRGVGHRLLHQCETQAAQAGFRRLALMATLPGEPFYLRHGYIGGAMQALDCGGITVRFRAMTKQLLPD